MAENAATKKDQRLTFGGMARWDGLELFGPSYMSTAYRRKGQVHVHVEPSKLRPPKSSVIRRASRLPLIRSVFFWGRLVWQVAGSLWTLFFFAATIAVLWLLVSLFEAGSGTGAAGVFFGLLAQFPILPVLALFFVVMKFTSVGRYHGAEHKAVAAYERYGEVTLEKARLSSRVHPRCGTNILIYIIGAALLSPLVDWWGYAILQFVLISEAWFTFGQSRPSIAVGNFLQRYLTTNEPRRAELEVAVESLSRLLRAEQEQTGAALVRAPARY